MFIGKPCGLCGTLRRLHVARSSIAGIRQIPCRGYPTTGESKIITVFAPLCRPGRFLRCPLRVTSSRPSSAPDRRDPCAGHGRRPEGQLGHPGAPMGMAEIAEVLWRRHLRHNPANPGGPTATASVQSNGHGSMLIYSLLHLTGYDLSIDDLKNFRQLHSKTRATRRSATPPASRPPPARWARASPTPWAWRWPKRCWPPSSTAPATPSSITTPTSSSATAA